VARTVLRLIEPTAGSIKLDGNDVTRLGKTELRPYRRADADHLSGPFSSLTRGMSAGDIVGEPLQVHDIAHGKEKQKLVGEIFDQVGLRAASMSAFPHEFSRRSAAAHLDCPRPLAQPEADRRRRARLRARCLDPGAGHQSDDGSAARENAVVLFIAHDLAVVEQSAIASRSCISARSSNTPIRRRCSLNPLHPYTEALLSAVPVPNPKLKARSASYRAMCEPINPGRCAFHTRCP